MNIGDLVRYECHGDIFFGLVLFMDTDDTPEHHIVFRILWSDNSSSYEYPDDETIEVIQ